MYACKSQDTQFITELIKYVEDINTSDNDGKTVSFVRNIKIFPQ
jgi:hypothetical protein